jgi:hypothetical protein
MIMIIMLDVTVILLWYVFIKATTKSDIDHLTTTTNAKERLAQAGQCSTGASPPVAVYVHLDLDEVSYYISLSTSYPPWDAINPLKQQIKIITAILDE